MTFAARMAGETRGAVRQPQVPGQSTAARDALRETARINSYTQPSNVLTAADAGDGTSTITMIAHKRVYPVQGNYDVPDLDFPNPVTLTGVALGTHGFVYHDDTTLQNVTPTLVFTTNEAPAQVGFAPGRHFDGEITTPASGAGSTTSSGPRPPGSGTALP